MMSSGKGGQKGRNEDGELNLALVGKTGRNQTAVSFQLMLLRNPPVNRVVHTDGGYALGSLYNDRVHQKKLVKHENWL